MRQVIIGLLVVSCFVVTIETSRAEERLVASEALVLPHPPINKSIGNPVHCLTFLNGGKVLATGATSGVHLWDTVSGELQKVLDVDERAVDALVQDPGGKRLVAGGAAGVIKVWDAKTLAPLGELGPAPAAVRSLAIAADASLLASVSPNLPPNATEPFSVMLWDLKTNKPLRSIEHPRPEFGSTVIAFLPDGERLLSAQDRTLRLIDVRQGTILKTIDLPDLPRTIGSIAIDQIGNRLATGVFEAKLRFWNRRDWKEVLSWDAHDKLAPPRRGVSTVSFSPDGKYLLSGGLDGLVCVWDVRDGHLLLELDGRGGSTSGWVTGVSITADNRWLGATHFGGTASVWQLSAEERK